MKLSAILRNKYFVEFPTIEIWQDEDAFDGMIVDDDGIIMRHAQGSKSQPKGRQLNRAAGKNVIKGLVRDYGSEEEEEEQNVLSILGDYATSDSHEDDIDSLISSPNQATDAFDDLSDQYRDGDVLEEMQEGMDTGALFDTMRQDQVESFIQDGCVMEVEDGREVDWGDSADEDDEEILLAHELSQC